MDTEIISYILPKSLLEYFVITKIEELEDTSLAGKKIQIHLEEKNEIPAVYDSSQYESKGFFPEKTIQDFPIRGKAVYLVIRRRRWRHKINQSEIHNNNYPLIASGSKMTQELSDFLKSID
jgi:hypothetical protein